VWSGVDDRSRRPRGSLFATLLNDHPVRRAGGLADPSERADLNRDYQHPTPPLTPDSPSKAHSLRAAVELTGDLPCVRCRYNLRGISISGRCPECGTPVRVTLLAVVDPQAEELRPITRPRLTSLGLLLWSASALGAAIIIAGWRVADVLSPDVMSRGNERLLGILISTLVVFSGVGALSLIRPHAGLSPRSVWAARAGAALYVPLAGVLFYIHCVIDPAIGSPYGGTEAVSVERITLRIIGAALIGLILLGLRPNGRALATRSLLMRTGQVDRQTLRALASALLLPFLGDLAELASANTTGGLSAGLHMAGSFLILGGSALFILGLVGVLVDCVRLVPIVSAPPLSLERLTRPDGGHA